MLVGIPIATVAAVLAWVFAPKLGINMRGRISMAALAAASVTGITAGFMYSDILGVCVLSASLFVIAFLFGYERG